MLSWLRDTWSKIQRALNYNYNYLKKSKRKLKRSNQDQFHHGAWRISIERPWVWRLTCQPKRSYRSSQIIEKRYGREKETVRSKWSCLNSIWKGRWGGSSRWAALGVWVGIVLRSKTSHKMKSNSTTRRLDLARMSEGAASSRGQIQWCAPNQLPRVLQEQSSRTQSND